MFARQSGSQRSDHSRGQGQQRQRQRLLSRPSVANVSDAYDNHASTDSDPEELQLIAPRPRYASVASAASFNSATSSVLLPSPQHYSHPYPSHHAGGMSSGERQAHWRSAADSQPGSGVASRRHTTSTTSGAGSGFYRQKQRAAEHLHHRSVPFPSFGSAVDGADLDGEAEKDWTMVGTMTHARLPFPTLSPAPSEVDEGASSGPPPPPQSPGESSTRVRSTSIAASASSASQPQKQGQRGVLFPAPAAKGLLRGTTTTAAGGMGGYDSMARRWVRWMAHSGLRSWTLPLTVAFAVWVRWAAGLGGYSGMGSPPMYGDYEAQRHWMEVVLHVPIGEWYYYDLPYWGLDYPPLTAYVSYVCALAAYFVHPDMVALTSSRGFESPESKVFMRASVLVLDLLLYFPAVYWCIERRWARRSRRTKSIAALTILLQPALIIVDHGHFQYNSVMLGLSLLSFAALHHASSALPLSTLSSAPVDQLASAYNAVVRSENVAVLLAAVFFVLSLGFKQMALYYAPAVFAAMLGRCFGLGIGNGFKLFVQLAVVTLLTFAALFSPFLTSVEAILQVVHRIFPLARGLFEDKVANFWCALNVVIKLRHFLTISSATRLSMALTLAAILPSCIHLFRIAMITTRRERRERERTLESVKERRTSADRSSSPLRERVQGAPMINAIPPTPPSKSRGVNSCSSPTATTTTAAAAAAAPPPEPNSTALLLPYALFNVSMAFFLFSFQVHEKSILLPLLPSVLLMGGKGGAYEGGGQGTEGEQEWEWGALLHNVGMFSMWPLLGRDHQGLQYVALTLFWNYMIGYNPFKLRGWFVKRLSLATYAAILTLHLAELVGNAPARYPDLYPVLNVLVCVPVFGLAWLWGLKRQLEVGWGLGVWRGGSGRSKKAREMVKTGEGDTTKVAGGGGGGGGAGSDRRSRSHFFVVPALVAN